MVLFVSEGTKGQNRPEAHRVGPRLQKYSQNLSPVM